jgi:stage V sporulation protein AD
MGAAMAPAAMQTIKTHLEDFCTGPEEYDLIVTGDLGQVGKEMLLELARQEGLPLGGRLAGCGTLVFDMDTQDVHAGGSGCGCSAITLCGDLLDKLNKGKLNRILFCGTGALLSPTSTQQGLPIPGICHGVSIISGRNV